MKKVIKVDEKGYFLEDVILQDEEVIPYGCVDVECSEGFYKPRFLDDKWIEGITEEELKKIEEDKLKNITLEERVLAIENLLKEVI